MGNFSLPHPSQMARCGCGVCQVMKQVDELRVPLKGDLEMGDNWEEIRSVA
jgi:DNA polymerase I-like protein with 3'-5' exonuclease and polymerase domains